MVAICTLFLAMSRRLSHGSREYSGACGEVGRGPYSRDATLKRRRSAAARLRVRHVGGDRDQFSRESTT